MVLSFVRSAPQVAWDRSSGLRVVAGCRIEDHSSFMRPKRLDVVVVGMVASK